MVKKENIAFVTSLEDATHSAQFLINQAIKESLEGDKPISPIAIILDKQLKEKETGEQVIIAIKGYCHKMIAEMDVKANALQVKKYKEALKKLFFISMSGQTHMLVNEAKMYHAFMSKPVSKGTIEQALYNAYTYASTQPSIEI